MKASLYLLTLSLGLGLNFTASAWAGNYHGHGQAHPQRYHNHSNMHEHFHGWYNGPSVIINLPYRGYYQPYCENVEVCNPYGYCWIERECN